MTPEVNWGERSLYQFNSGQFISTTEPIAYINSDMVSTNQQQIKTGNKKDNETD